MTLTSAVRALPSLRRGHTTKPCTKKHAPAEWHGTWRQIFTSSRIRTKLFFNFPRATLAHTSTSPEGREFVVDSGASMHMLSKKGFLSSDEMETLRRSRNSTTVVTANGEVQTNEEAQVHVHDLDLFVTVQILDDTPAVLTSGKLCKENGHTYEWVSDQKPRLTKRSEENCMQNGKFRTSCPWIVVKIWYQFVLYIATAGLVKYIFKSSIRAK